jgi:hypothetical protein
MRGQLWLATAHRAVASTPSVHSVPPSTAYLWIPIAAGGGLAILLVLLTGLIGVPYVDQGVAQTAGLLDARFWTTRFYASAAWTFSDSGVTNITALATAVVAILASSAVTSIFTTDLNPFIIMNVVCGGIVAAAPILFGVCNVVIMRRNPVVTADARLVLREDATITLPFGASITVAGGATVATPDGKSEKARIKAGGTVPVPPGSVITVKASAIMALPSGSVLAISRGAVLTVDSGCQIAAGDLVPALAASPGAGHHLFSRHSSGAPPDPEIAVGDLITVTEGATATVTGVADILFPNATIVAPGHSGMGLAPNTTLTVPTGPNVMAAGMGSVLPTAILTTFGAGAEIGLVGVLAAHYSTAGGAGDVAAIVISAVVAAVLVLYGATAIRALADPTPGTSLSSAAGTSFTL